MIAAIAEKWDGGYWSEEYVELEKKSESVFVNGNKAEKMLFNHIQLRFVMSGGAKFLLFDGRTESDFLIEEIFNQLS